MSDVRRKSKIEIDQSSKNEINRERKGYSQSRKKGLTYQQFIKLQSSQEDICSTKPKELPKTDLMQSSESSKQHCTGWDDEIFSPPQPMEEDETSRRFLENIQQIKGKTIDDIVALIPKNATAKELITGPELEKQGFEYSWQSPQGNWWTVRVHSLDYNAFLPKDCNSSKGWIVRVRRDNEYMDSSGNFHPVEKAQPGGNDSIINETHIPIQTPDPYVCPLTHPNEQTEWGREQLRRIANILSRGQIQS